MGLLTKVQCLVKINKFGLRMITVLVIFWYSYSNHRKITNKQFDGTDIYFYFILLL